MHLVSLGENLIPPEARSDVFKTVAMLTKKTERVASISQLTTPVSFQPNRQQLSSNSSLNQLPVTAVQTVTLPSYGANVSSRVIVLPPGAKLSSAQILMAAGLIKDDGSGTAALRRPEGSENKVIKKRITDFPMNSVARPVRPLPLAANGGLRPPSMKVLNECTIASYLGALQPVPLDQIYSTGIDLLGSTTATTTMEEEEKGEGDVKLEEKEEAAIKVEQEELMVESCSGCCSSSCPDCSRNVVPRFGYRY